MKEKFSAAIKKEKVFCGHKERKVFRCHKGKEKIFVVIQLLSFN